MALAIRCKNCGPQFVECQGVVPCPVCGRREESYESGAPAKQEGLPHIIGDEVRKHYDWSCGEWITSKSQRRRIYEQKGLTMRSVAEHRRHNAGSMEKSGRAVSYAGRRDNRSTSERQQLE